MTWPDAAGAATVAIRPVLTQQGTPRGGQPASLVGQVDDDQPVDRVQVPANMSDEHPEQHFVHIPHLRPSVEHLFEFQ